MSRRLRLAGARAFPHLLLVGVLIALGLLFREWAYATTYRLYLSHRVDAATSSTATQRFDLEGDRVVPQIAMHDDRVAFRAAIGRDSTIRAEVRPQGAARYEIHVRRSDGDERICAGEVSRPASVACPFPTGIGTLEIVGRGALTWSDLRIERGLLIAPEVVLVLLLACAGVLLFRDSPQSSGSVSSWRLTPRARRAWGSALTLLISTGVATAGVEAALHVVGTRLSPPISAARHDLGELTVDPRWQRAPGFGQRLAANFDGTNLWRHGDIIRMGFLSPSLGDGQIHLYRLHTDAEGFRNSAIRDPIDVAALGDSFTDALTLPVEQAWPMQLEQRLGWVVQNYGTAGFGPQQELRALQDYAIRHRPRAVVLAFFAGNDLRDAEVFEASGRTDLAIGHPQLGWPIKDIVSRADTWFLVNALRAASVAAASLSPAEVSASEAAPAKPADTASFDRGLFTVPINGRVVRWAFMPPYLHALNFSEADLASRRGWALVRENVSRMQQLAQAAGARFVVMFLPSKSQVYLPVLTRTFGKEALTDALAFSIRQVEGAADVDRLWRNRLALNNLMRRFCEDSDIPFVDMTEPLIARLESGENVYFPDDSHLNAVGQSVVAAALADFLRATLPGVDAADRRGPNSASGLVSRDR